MRHDDEALGADLGGQDAGAELGVGFVFQVLVEGADFGLVRFVVLGAVFGEGGALDGGGDGEDGAGRGGGVLAEAVVEEADAVVARGLAGARAVDAVFFPGAFGGRDRAFRFVVVGAGGGRGAFGGGAVGGLIGRAGFFFVDVVTPFLDDIVGEAGDFWVLVLL